MAALEIGVRAPHGVFGEGPSAIADFARGVEASGLARIWVSDHVSYLLLSPVASDPKKPSMGRPKLVGC